MKSRYFFEPRQLIVVDPALLQPTPALRTAFRKVKEHLANKSNFYTVDHLFNDFGTHACTRALLGGWWKITSTFKSTKRRSAVEMSTIVSSAIDTLVAKQSSVDIGVSSSGIKAGFSKKDSSSS